MRLYGSMRRKEKGNWKKTRDREAKGIKKKTQARKEKPNQH